MKYKVVKGLISQKMEGKLVIFDGEKSVLYTLNETAAFIFKKIKAGKDKKNIVNQLVEKYKIERKRAQEDVDELVGDFKKKGIIEPLK